MNLVIMPTGGGAPVEVPVAVYVDDSALAQSGPESVPSLRRVVNANGLMYYLLVDSPGLVPRDSDVHEGPHVCGACVWCVEGRLGG